VSLLYCVSSVFCFHICFILLICGPIFLTMITKDDIDLVVEKVQDHASKAFDEAKNQRGKIQDDLDRIKQVLEQINTT
jgi:ABC-type transporter MlaC component